MSFRMPYDQLDRVPTDQPETIDGAMFLRGVRVTFVTNVDPEVLLDVTFMCKHMIGSPRATAAHSVADLIKFGMRGAYAPVNS